MNKNIENIELWINPNIPYLFNKDIIEYDMKEAGFSLIKEFGLLSKDQIEKIGELAKKERTIYIGKLQRGDSKLKENLKRAFAEARRQFYTKNNLDINEIISIKKDAIFVSRICEYQSFGKNILFRPKNHYSSYIQLDKKMEFYYSPLKLDIKGLSSDEKIIELHNDYLISFIKLFFSKMETESPINVISFMRRFITKYKRKELEVGYYRRFDRKSNFDTILNDGIEYYDYWEDEKENLDITYNFNKILLKLLQIPLY